LNEPVSLSRPLSSNNLQDQEQKGDGGGAGDEGSQERMDREERCKRREGDRIKKRE